MVAAYACEAVAMQVGAVIGGLGNTRAPVHDAEHRPDRSRWRSACRWPRTAGSGAALAGFVVVQIGRVI